MTTILDSETFIQRLKREKRLIPNTITHQGERYHLRDKKGERSWWVVAPNSTIEAMCRVRGTLLASCWGMKKHIDALLEHVVAAIQPLVLDDNRVMRPSLRLALRCARARVPLRVDRTVLLEQKASDQ